MENSFGKVMIFSDENRQCRLYLIDRKLTVLGTFLGNFVFTVHIQVGKYQILKKLFKNFSQLSYSKLPEF